MAYRVEYAAASIVGLIRKNNEDNFYIDSFYLPEINQGQEEIRTGVLESGTQPLAAVFDGMGGMLAGETAAYLSARTMAEAEQLQPQEPFQTASDQQLIEQMNQAVFAYAEEEKIHGMGATLVMMRFLKNEIRAYNLGDSSIYGMQEDRLEKLSEDHILRIPGRKKAPITQFLGMDLEEYVIKPGEKSLSVREGAQYLLCSDGVTDMLTDETLEEILKEEISLKEKVRKILDLVLEAGARDNTTLILCRIKNTEADGGDCSNRLVSEDFYAGDYPNSRCSGNDLKENDSAYCLRGASDTESKEGHSRKILVLIYVIGTLFAAASFISVYMMTQKMEQESPSSPAVAEENADTAVPAEVPEPTAELTLTPGAAEAPCETVQDESSPSEGSSLESDR